MRPEAPPDPRLVPTLTEVLEVPDLGEVPSPVDLGAEAPQIPPHPPTARRSGAAAAPDFQAVPGPDPFADPRPDRLADPLADSLAGPHHEPLCDRLAAEVAAELMRLLEPEVRQLARRAVEMELQRESEAARGN